MARDYKPKRKRPGSGFSGVDRRRVRSGRRPRDRRGDLCQRSSARAHRRARRVAKIDKRKPRGGDPADADGADAGASDDSAKSYAFYDMLPKFEVVVPEKDKDVRPDTRAVPETRSGTYVLQAGSYKNFADADRVRAQIGFAGGRVQSPEGVGGQRYVAPHPHRSDLQSERAQPLAHDPAQSRRRRAGDPRRRLIPKTQSGP